MVDGDGGDEDHDHLAVDDDVGAAAGNEDDAGDDAVVGDGHKVFKQPTYRRINPAQFRKSWSCSKTNKSRTGFGGFEYTQFNKWFLMLPH